MTAAFADRAMADAGKKRKTRNRNAQKKDPAPKPLTVQFPLRPNGNAGDKMKQVRVLSYETGQRQAGNAVWIHKDDFPWFVRYACEEVAIGSGGTWEADPVTDMRNRLEYLPGATTWRCSWYDPATGLMQSVERRVPRNKIRGGMSRPMSPMEFLSAKEKARTALMEEARHRGCDVNGLAVADSAMVAPDP